jgi:hypothetical protein
MAWAQNDPLLRRAFQPRAVARDHTGTTTVHLSALQR